MWQILFCFFFFSFVLYSIVYIHKHIYLSPHHICRPNDVDLFVKYSVGKMFFDVVKFWKRFWVCRMMWSNMNEVRDLKILWCEWWFTFVDKFIVDNLVLFQYTVYIYTYDTKKDEKRIIIVHIYYHRFFYENRMRMNRKRKKTYFWGGRCFILLNWFKVVNY